MGRSFDELTRRAWSRFEERVREVLSAHRQGYLFLTLLTPGEPGVPVLEIDFDEPDVTLWVADPPSAQDRSILRALGWQRCHMGSEDWNIELEDEGSAYVPTLVSDTLRLALRVPDPALLLGCTEGVALEPMLPAPVEPEVGAQAARAQASTPLATEAGCGPAPSADGSAVPSGWVVGRGRDPEDGADEDDGDELVEPAELPRIAFAYSHDELEQMTRHSLRFAFGEDHEADSEGDYPIPGSSVPLWVRVIEERPVIRVFSYVVRSVRDARQARIEIGILNRRIPLLTFTWERGMIVATHDILAAPFVGTQLLNALHRIGCELDDLAPDLALRVGGKLWVPGSADADPA